MTLPGFHECGECEGTGATWGDYPGSIIAQGWYYDKPCPECGGAGQVPDDNLAYVVGRTIQDAEEDDTASWPTIGRAALLAYARHTQETKP